MLVKYDVLIIVAHTLQVALKVFILYHHRASAVIRVKGEGGGVPDVLIEKEIDFVVLIIYQAEGRHAAWLQAQILHHPFGRGKGEFATRGQSTALQRSLEFVFEVVNGEVVVAVEANQIMLVALMVSEKQVFAVHAAIVLPPLLRLLDGLALRMIVIGKGNVVLPQVCQYFFFSRHNKFVFAT